MTAYKLCFWCLASCYCVYFTIPLDRRHSAWWKTTRWRCYKCPSDSCKRLTRQREHVEWHHITQSWLGQQTEVALVWYYRGKRTHSLSVHLAFESSPCKANEEACAVILFSYYKTQGQGKQITTLINNTAVYSFQWEVQCEQIPPRVSME